MLNKLKYLFLILIVASLSVESFGQAAKKPRLVVIPSDALMNQMGLLNTTDDMGEVNYVQNYKEAFLDTDLKACISKISELFTDRGFDLTQLEAELRRVQGKDMVIAEDIRLELNYKINKQGPRDILYFELTALDAYSGKQVAASSGQSKPAISETKVNLLQEAVIDKMDKFILDIDNYFNSLAEIGRESRLTIESDGVEIPMEVEEFVDEWLTANCVRGSFSIDEVDETVIRVSQAMMPLFDEREKALSARNFYKPLAKELNVAFPELKFSQKSSPKFSGSDGGGTLADSFILVEENF